jgi:hypothetical protein
MNVIMKAPAGGIVSRVNGQFYNGGEFIPDTGVYCGKSGAKRRKMVERFTPAGRVFGSPDAGRLFEVERRAGFPWVGVAFAADRAGAIALVAAAGVTGVLTAREVI